MKCAQINRLFGAYWDDETTQAEREWVETHLASCAACRKQYEEFSRSLELIGSLPRVEPAPDLVERVLARARRAVPAPDRVPAASRRWIPVTAAVALLVVAGSLALPWLGTRTERGRAPVIAGRVTPHESQLTHATSSLPSQAAPSARAGGGLVAQGGKGATDSLFDHSEDIEFILDPVRLQRGRATVTRAPAVQGEKAVLSF